MILRPDGDGLLAIGQASHAWLSGQLARAWVPRPEPFEEVCLGALQHDVGMAEWDLDPQRHPDTGLPTILVYDGYPGGAGFAERGYEAMDVWLAGTRNAIASCCGSALTLAMSVW